MTLAAWCISQNFGDRLTWWMIRHITGLAPAWVPFDDPRPHYVVAGSVLNHATATSTVWGAGLASASDGVTKAATILATRGPLSAAIARSFGASVPDVYGDPAMLLPRLMPRTHGPTRRLGVVCHYIDQSDAPAVAGAAYINVLDDVADVIASICDCEHIVSSSLHGMIVADAYGIPAAYAKGQNIGGDGMKFDDHMLATGELVAPIELSFLHGMTAEQVIDFMPRRRVEYDPEPLAACCPFGTI
jgi:pyruvyltransferase